MLRFLVILLLLANAGYYSWTRGWLADAGMAPAITGEPRRLERQIRPQDIVLIAEPPLLPQTPPVATPSPPSYTGGMPFQTRSEAPEEEEEEEIPLLPEQETTLP